MIGGNLLVKRKNNLINLLINTWIGIICNHSRHRGVVMVVEIILWKKSDISRKKKFELDNNNFKGHSTISEIKKNSGNSGKKFLKLNDL